MIRFLEKKLWQNFLSKKIEKKKDAALEMN